ncbi:MAG: hypothetical protein HOP11_07865 [Saprospiraceae bacterium]|nr:hypothetical protein [Saprospiraceae bacterium]
MSDYSRIDRSFFQALSAEESDKIQTDYSQESYEVRLEVAYYLTSIAYGFDVNDPPRIDKTQFEAKAL